MAHSPDFTEQCHYKSLYNFKGGKALLTLSERVSAPYYNKIKIRLHINICKNI